MKSTIEFTIDKAEFYELVDSAIQHRQLYRSPKVYDYTIESIEGFDDVWVLSYVRKNGGTGSQTANRTLNPTFRRIGKGVTMDWRKEVEEFKKSMAVVEPSVGAMLFRFATFGEVASGKSVTSAMVALAATPKPGLVGVVDGENSRSKIAIDEAARLGVEKYGGKKEDFISRFKVVHVDPPFNPLRVIAAGEALIEAGCSTLILDILTQAWDSSGGYLDMKEQVIDQMCDGDEGRRQKVAQAAAARVKPWTHNKLVHWIDEVKVNLILCFQAKQKWNPQTKQVDRTETPIQETGITRTAIAVARIYSENGVGGFCDFTCLPGQTKYSSEELLRLLPHKQQMTFSHAEKMVDWFSTRAGGKSTTATTAPQSVTSPDKERARLGKRLIELLADVHGVSASDAKSDEKKTQRTNRMTQWLIEQSILSDTESLGELPVERLGEVVTQAERAINEAPTP